MAAKDYYTLLGITRNSEEDEIRKAYRNLARKYHPDVNKETDAQERFKEINEAYEVLKDPEKRKRYDKYGSNWQRMRTADQEGFDFGSAGGFKRTYSFNNRGEFGERTSFSDIFGSIFRDTGGTPFNDVADFAAPSRADEAELEVTISELYSRAEKTFTLQTVEPSPNGNYNQVNKTLKVKIPQGITDGSAIRISGQGSYDPHTGQNRDLKLRVVIREDPRFTVKGFNLYTVVPVSPWEAALGCRILVETIDGTVNLSIPAGSQSGRKFRLRSKGLPGKSGAAGDIIVELEVRIPTKLSAEEEQLFKKLADTSRFNPRKEGRQGTR